MVLLIEYFEQSRQGQEDSSPPPVDYRYGWNMSKGTQQKALMQGLIIASGSTLFVSPNCAPWGNQTRSLPSETLAAKRAEDILFLTFLCAACFVQVLLGLIIFWKIAGIATFVRQVRCVGCEHSGFSWHC